MDYNARKDMLICRDSITGIQITMGKPPKSNISVENIKIIPDLDFVINYGCEFLGTDEISNQVGSICFVVKIKCINTAVPGGGFIVGNKSAVMIPKGTRMFSMEIN